MADGRLVRGDGPIHQVANGHHAEHPVSIQNRQVPDAMLGHRSHAFFYGVIGTRGDYAIGHNLPDLGFFGRPVLQNHFAGVIALGNNAGQTAFRHH